MRSRTGNPLSTLVFLVPLLGVPLMAIFGVPQFVPVIASSVNDETVPALTPRRTGGVGESAAATSLVSEKSLRDFGRNDDERLRDLFRPAERSRRDRRPLRSDSHGRETKFVETSLNADVWTTSTSSEGRTAEPTQALADLFGTETSPSRQTELTSRNLATVTRPRAENFAVRSNAARLVTDSEHSDEGLTWRDAVRRLNELGIQEFRLEPGRQLGEFYFACEFAPDRDARIMRRFEAEAAEPLLAVEAVLRQIDEWLPRR